MTNNARARQDANVQAAGAPRYSCKAKSGRGTSEVHTMELRRCEARTHLEESSSEWTPFRRMSVVKPRERERERERRCQDTASASRSARPRHARLSSRCGYSRRPAPSPPASSEACTHAPVWCRNCLISPARHQELLAAMALLSGPQGWWVNVNPVFTRWSLTPRPGRCWYGLTPPPTGVNPLY